MTDDEEREVRCDQMAVDIEKMRFDIAETQRQIAERQRQYDVQQKWETRKFLLSGVLALAAALGAAPLSAPTSQNRPRSSSSYRPDLSFKLFRQRNDTESRLPHSRCAAMPRGRWGRAAARYLLHGNGCLGLYRTGMDRQSDRNGSKVRPKPLGGTSRAGTKRRMYFLPTPTT